MGIFFTLFFLLFSLSIIFLQNVHYLVILLSLEFTLLIVFILSVRGDTFQGGFFFFFLFFLASVCLGGFSISYLVSLSRNFGQDAWFGKSLL